MSWIPQTKVVAGTVGGAVTTIVLWLLDAYARLDMPEPVSAAVGVLVTLVVAYLVPNKASTGDSVPPVEG